MLGWRILKSGEYCLDIPVLSEDEEKLICAAEERFKEATRSTVSRTRQESGELIRDVLLSSAEENGLYLDRDQTAYLCKVAAMHIYGFAFLDELLSDPEIEEISVIGPGKPVYVYVRNKGWKEVNACFQDERTIADMTNRMARNLGRHITLQNPRLDAMLPDGSRLHASLPPVSAGEMTVRKFRDRPFSPKELVENRTISYEAMALLSLIMQCDSSVIIAGNTASGKTTTLNALFSFVAANERVLITEETPEINIPHKHQMRLVANRDMGITLKDLVYDSLRMRPDRMIVGEVRSKDEAEALFDVLLAGQARGSYATMHAQSVDEAFSRLRTFGVTDLQSIDCLVVQRRMLLYDPKKKKNTEVRRVVEIAELEPKPKIIYKDGRLGRSCLLDKVAETFGMKSMAAELRNRAKLIARAAVDFHGFYGRVQKELYGYEINEDNEDENGIKK